MFTLDNFNAKLPKTTHFVSYRNREQWLDDRKLCLNASEVPVLFGEGYSGQTVMNLWAEKTQEVSPNGATRFMDAGSAMEPILRQWFEDETGFTVLAPEPPEHWRYYCEKRNLGMSPDGLLAEGILQIKTIYNYQTIAQWQTGHLPIRTELQIQAELLVTGAECAYAYAMLGSPSDTCVIRVEPDPMIQDAIEAKVAQFDEALRNGVMPPPEADDSALLQKLFAKVKPKAVARISDPAAIDMVTSYETRKEELKNLQKEVDQLNNALKALAGENEFLAIGDNYFSWKQQTRKSYVVEEATFRVLRRIKALPKGVA